MIFKSKRVQKTAGDLAENKALDFLRKQGLKLITRNYRTNYGEIDLIMQDNNTVVFVEVRYRKSSRFGSPVESVDLRKQQKVRATAQQFLSERKIGGRYALRFDVVGIEQQNLQWIENAF